MRKILVFFSLLAIISCESIEYDGETRLVVQGQTVDENNASIRDISVRIKVFSGTNDASDIISYGTSDPFGNFKLVIPAPKSEDNFIRIELTKPGYANQPQIIDSIMRNNFHDYKLDLGRIRIKEFQNVTRNNPTITYTSLN